MGIDLPEPTLIFVAGGPATGKTTILDELIPRFNNVCLIDIDDIKESFLRTPGKTDGFNAKWYGLSGPAHEVPSDHHRENVSLQARHCMLEQAETNLNIGISPFLQGNYTSQMKLGYFQEVVEPFLSARGLDSKTKILFCYADNETIARRIKERNASRDAEKLKSEEAMRSYMESQDFLPEALESLDHLKLDGTKHPDENTKLAIDYLIST